MRVGRETDEGDRTPERGERREREEGWGDEEGFGGCRKKEEKWLVRVEEREGRIL